MRMAGTNGMSAGGDPREQIGPGRRFGVIKHRNSLGQLVATRLGDCLPNDANLQRCAFAGPGRDAVKQRVALPRKGHAPLQPWHQHLDQSGQCNSSDARSAAVAFDGCLDDSAIADKRCPRFTDPALVKPFSQGQRLPTGAGRASRKAAVP